MAKQDDRRDEERVVTTMRIPQSVLAKVDRKAKQAGVTRSRFVLTLLEKGRAPARPKKVPAKSAADAAPDIFD